MRSHGVLARNQGCVLLIHKGNPKNITGVEDLMHQGFSHHSIAVPGKFGKQLNVWHDNLKLRYAGSNN